MSSIQRILLAEDHQATGELYRQVLEQHGFSVDYAHDGTQALSFALQGGYNLILLDVRMPKMDGLEVLKQLQLTPPQKANGPIVMLTNLIDEDLIKQAMSQGAVSYMDKSNLNPEELAKKVFGVLGMPDKSEE